MAFEAMAERVIVAGYFGLEELMGATAAERTQFYKMLVGEKPGWARLMRKMLDRSSPS